MLTYRAGGRTAATAATANHVAAQLWNPSSASPIWVSEIHVVSTTAGVSNLAIQRSTGRGTSPTATVTPDIDNDTERLLSPVSASVLELATFSSQPTLATPSLENWNLPASIGAGVIFGFTAPIKVGPGLGLCVYTPASVILPASDVTFVWAE